jgi:hypothetical protein
MDFMWGNGILIWSPWRRVAWKVAWKSPFLKSRTSVFVYWGAVGVVWGVGGMVRVELSGVWRRQVRMCARNSVNLLWFNEGSFSSTLKKNSLPLTTWSSTHQNSIVVMTSQSTPFAPMPSSPILFLVSFRTKLLSMPGAGQWQIVLLPHGLS